MFEFEVMNRKNGETDVILGHTFKEACESAGLDTTEWKVIGKWYID